MSDPVTNVEIEDVLSSIRRLVSDGDKARTRDPAPIVADEASEQDLPEDVAEVGESMLDKFVLTPAFMVVDNDTTSQNAIKAEEYHSAEDDEGYEDAGWVEEISAEQDVHQPEAVKPDGETEEKAADVASVRVPTASASDANISTDEAVADDDVPQFDGLQLTDMDWDSANEARKAGLAAVPAQAGFSEATDTATARDDSVTTAGQTPDRSKLIASIAELEAAITNDVQDFEPDGSEVEDKVMGETIAWPGSVVRSLDDVQVAEEVAQITPDFEAEIDDITISFEHRSAAVDAAPKDRAGAGEEQDYDFGDDEGDDDDYGDDDLDGLLDTGSVSLDEDALRTLVSEVVREELAGPMGERITRNVRKLVRREIYRILSSKEFE